MFAMLTINRGRLVLQSGWVGNAPPTELAVITRVEDLTPWLEGGLIEWLACSSSVDFPEDETDDPKLIALCRAIRGNGEEA
jgi:hypothetical protein